APLLSDRIDDHVAYQVSVHASLVEQEVCATCLLVLTLRGSGPARTVRADLGVDQTWAQHCHPDGVPSGPEVELECFGQRNHRALRCAIGEPRGTYETRVWMGCQPGSRGRVDNMPAGSSPEHAGKERLDAVVNTSQVDT